MRSLELSILDILTEDARTPVSQMSVMLGVSQTEIAETIARLEKQRIIIKYPALIHWEKVETEQVEALIEVRITPMRDRGFDAVAEQIYRFDEVSSVFLMSGGYDLMVILKARTLKQLAQLPGGGPVCGQASQPAGRCALHRHPFRSEKI